MDNEDNDRIEAINRELRQLTGKMLDNGVNIILCDLQIAIRKTYPYTIDSEPYARKIVAYIREHLVKP